MQSRPFRKRSCPPLQIRSLQIRRTGWQKRTRLRRPSNGRTLRPASVHIRTTFARSRKPRAGAASAALQAGAEFARRSTCAGIGAGVVQRGARAGQADDQLEEFRFMRVLRRTAGCLRGRRWTIADAAALLGVSNSKSRTFLRTLSTIQKASSRDPCVQ